MFLMFHCGCSILLLQRMLHTIHTQRLCPLKIDFEAKSKVIQIRKPSLIYLKPTFHVSLLLILADFFQYLAACCQMNAIKNSYKNNNPNINDVTREEYSPPDFMNNKTWLDFIKVMTNFFDNLKNWERKLRTFHVLLYSIWLSTDCIGTQEERFKEIGIELIIQCLYESLSSERISQ